MSMRLVTIAQITVATSGTEQRVSATDVSNVVKLIVSAPTTNTLPIYLGDSSVATSRGIEIPKGTTYELDAPQGGMLDIKNMYIDAGTNGDKANCSYLKRVVG